MFRKKFNSYNKMCDKAIETESESESLSSPPITHVIFDFDGTLVNTMDIYLDEFRDVARSYGKQFNTLFESYMINITSWSKLVRDFIALHDIDCDAESVEQLETEIKRRLVGSIELQLIPGVDRLVKHLHKHDIPMAIATGSSEQQFTQIIKHFANYFEPKHYFSHFVCGNDREVISSKPNPQIYWVCAKRFDSPPVNIRNVLVFEDSVTGITGAVASGMQTVWVKDRRVECNDGINCSLVINSLTEFEPQMFGLPAYQ